MVFAALDAQQPEDSLTAPGAALESPVTGQVASLDAEQELAQDVAQAESLEATAPGAAAELLSVVVVLLQDASRLRIAAAAIVVNVRVIVEYLQKLCLLT